MRIKIDILLKFSFLPVENTLLPSSFVTWILTLDGWLVVVTHGFSSHPVHTEDTYSMDYGSVEYYCSLERRE